MSTESRSAATQAYLHYGGDMTTGLDSAFLAKDAFDSWKQRVSAARESIRVFTPLLDTLLIGLLGDVGLDSLAISVVTDLSPASGAPDYREHLRGVKRLLEDGIVVLTLHQLRAVVLVCDGQKVSVGSQVFTQQARSFRAATMFPGNDVSGSDFSRTLDEWYSSARVVELEFVEQLLEDLDAQANAVLHAQQDLAEEFDALLDDREREQMEIELLAALRIKKGANPGGDEDDEKSDELVDEVSLEEYSLEEYSLEEYSLEEYLPLSLDDGGSTSMSSESDASRLELLLGQSTNLPPIAGQLDRALHKAPGRRARSSILACLKDAGEWGEYQSLIVDGDSDLTQWVTVTPEGAHSTAKLARLRMHPLILNPSGRMGFARVGKSRITYIRTKVSWTSPRKIGGRGYSMLVEFPDHDLEKSNMSILLHSVSRSSAGVALGVRFDGVQATLTDCKPLGGNVEIDDFSPWLGVTGSEPTPADMAAELTQPEMFTEVIRQAFSPFRYAELGRERRNADDFFPRAWLRVTMIDYRGQSVLVATNA